MLYLRLKSISFLIVLISSVFASAAETSNYIDLSKAVIVASEDGAVVNTAQRMLTEEVLKRTGIELAKKETINNGALPIILLCQADKAPAPFQKFISNMNVPKKEDGFSIAVYTGSTAPVIVLAGYDEGGVLFAAGRLLLNLNMTKEQLKLPENYRIATAPRYPHRGHQMGYRSLAHTYDAWTPDIYEQYMRELAVFGANAFETTSFGPEDRDGPHAKGTKGEMMIAWSRICADYGFDFWLFGSASGGQGRTDKYLEDSIQSKLNMLRALPHLDHIYLTGGDGGTSHRRPDLMIEWVSRFSEEARKIHPDLGVWVSNQGFGPELNNWFFDYLQKEQPEWLTGVVYGAWSRVLLDEQRARVPKQYPIRRYSDIGHCLRSQYPVPGWDRAFAQTLGREPFAPRPKGHAQIHNLFDQYADGFVTYSDGVGDDVNKFVWTALGWNPDRALDEIMLDYSRFFFGWDIADKVQEGIYRLEEHFTGSLAENDDVEETFALWKSLEDNADDALLNNWRFQECLLRAYYDHYTRLRLLKANASEQRAYDALRKAPKTGVKQAIKTARAILAESDQDAKTDILKVRIIKLGAELFESIGAQLDVPNYKAYSAERGAVLDFLDNPLNNKLWIEDELDAILTGRFTATMPEKLGNGDVRLVRLARVYDWENPGPGSFYDDLGCSWKQPHLVKPKPLWDDPAGITTPREGHSMEKGAPNRLSWTDTSDAHYAAPLTMRYEGLDPNATYRVRVTYLGRYKATIKLVADGAYEIHGAFGHTLEGARYTVTYGDSAASIAPEKDGVPRAVTPLEFLIPPAATSDGKLELNWERFTGRGIQVAEVWLIKE